MAEAFGAQLYAVESQGGRGYDTVAALNQAREVHVEADYSRVCRLSKYLVRLCPYSMHDQAEFEQARIKRLIKPSPPRPATRRQRAQE